MSMKLLTEKDEQFFREAVTGVNYNREGFLNAVSKLRHGKGISPEGFEYNTESWPSNIKEWRAKEEWAINLLNSHQAAVREAELKFWEVFINGIKNVPL